MEGLSVTDQSGEVWCADRVKKMRYPWTIRITNKPILLRQRWVEGRESQIWPTSQMRCSLCKAVLCRSSRLEYHQELRLQNDNSNDKNPPNHRHQDQHQCIRFSQHHTLKKLRCLSDPPSPPVLNGIPSSRSLRSHPLHQHPIKKMSRRQRSDEQSLPLRS
jgi:hypothetical protein